MKVSSPHHWTTKEFHTAPLPSSARASVAVALGLSYSVACGVLLSRGSNPCPLHWQVILIHCVTREIPYCSLLGFADTVAGLGSWFTRGHSLWQNPGLRLCFHVLLVCPALLLLNLLSPLPWDLWALCFCMFVCMYLAALGLSCTQHL